MTRQLATMVSSGMTILRALYVLEAQTESKPLADVIVKVRKDVEAGLPLSDALERHPKTFSPLFVAMTRAGETGGVLEESLMRVADQLEKEDSLRRQIKSAMVYPGVVLTFALSVLIGLVTFLVPVFVGVFKQFGGDLPTITKFTVALSNSIKGYWWAWILISVGAVWAFRKWKSTYRGRGQWDAMRLRIPNAGAGPLAAAGDENDDRVAADEAFDLLARLFECRSRKLRIVSGPEPSGGRGANQHPFFGEHVQQRKLVRVEESGGDGASKPVGVFRIRFLRDRQILTKQRLDGAQDVPAAAARAEEQNVHLTPSLMTRPWK